LLAFDEIISLNHIFIRYMIFDTLCVLAGWNGFIAKDAIK